MKYSPRRPARRLALGDLIFFLLFIRVYFAFSSQSQWKGRGNQGSRRTSLPDPLSKLHLPPPCCEIYRNEWALTVDHFFPLRCRAQTLRSSPLQGSPCRAGALGRGCVKSREPPGQGEGQNRGAVRVRRRAGQAGEPGTGGAPGAEEPTRLSRDFTIL